jgi:hypothetical protein
MLTYAEGTSHVEGELLLFKNKIPAEVGLGRQLRMLLVASHVEGELELWRDRGVFAYFVDFVLEEC